MICVFLNCNHVFASYFTCIFGPKTCLLKSLSGPKHWDAAIKVWILERIERKRPWRIFHVSFLNPRRACLHNNIIKTPFHKFGRIKTPCGYFSARYKKEIHFRGPASFCVAPQMNKKKNNSPTLWEPSSNICAQSREIFLLLKWRVTNGCSDTQVSARNALNKLKRD